MFEENVKIVGRLRFKVRISECGRVLYRPGLPTVVKVTAWAMSEY